MLQQHQQYLLNRFNLLLLLLLWRKSNIRLANFRYSVINISVPLEM